LALLAEKIPKHHRELFRRIGQPEILRAGDEGGAGVARLRQAGEIALHIGEEHRRSGLGEPFREALQRDSLAAAGGAGNQPVAIAERQQQITID
jgi:hypothetical protein